MSASKPIPTVTKVHLDHGDIWFTTRGREPSAEEVAAWVPRYEARLVRQMPGEPLIVDVETEGLRSASRP